MTGEIAAVQARINELRQLVAPQRTSQTTAALSATGTQSFAAALEALGVDASGVDASGGTSLSGLSSLTGLSSRTGSAAAATGQGLVDAASKYIGVPYVWGGESLAEGGLDCSGLVQLAMSDLGVTGIPRVAKDQMTIGTPVASLDQALPGDLLVFRGGAHIAIYVGDGKMIDAPKPGGHVGIRDVYDTPNAIRRVLPQATSTAAGTSATELALSSAAVQRASLDQLLRAAS